MAVSRTRSSTRTTTSPDPGSGRHSLDQVPVAAVRAGITRERAVSRADIMLSHMPASACRVRWRVPGSAAQTWRPQPAAARAAQPAESQSRPDHRPGGAEDQQMPHAGGARRSG